MARQMTKAEFQAALPEGCTYEKDGEAHTVRLPERTRIIGGDCHDAYLLVARPFISMTTAQVYRALLSQLEAGLEPCTDLGCEFCDTDDQREPVTETPPPAQTGKS